MSISREEEVSKKLAEPFPQSAHQTRRAGGGKDLTYVQGHVYIHRLNDATGNRWDFSVDKIERTQIDDSNALLMAYVTLEIPGLGKRSHVGVQMVNARGGEDLVKGCVTDALKKAASLFGVGLELYGPDYEAGEIGNTPQTHQNGPGATLPPRDRSTSTNTVTDEPTAYPSGVTNKQVKAIGAIASKLGLEPEEVKRMHGKDSATLLSRTEASALIERLSAMEAERGQQQAMAGVSGDPNRWGQ
jgi:hypothetical protein